MPYIPSEIFSGNRGHSARSISKVNGRGLNYTYLNRCNDRSSGAYVRLTDVPAHKVFANMKYRTPLTGLSVLGTFEYTSSRTTTSDGVNESGPAAVANGKVMYEAMKNFILEGGVNNLFNRSYQYQNGYPQAGRTFFAGVRCSF